MKSNIINDKKCNRNDLISQIAIPTIESVCNPGRSVFIPESTASARRRVLHILESALEIIHDVDDMESDLLDEANGSSDSLQGPQEGHPKRTKEE